MDTPIKDTIEITSLQRTHSIGTCTNSRFAGPQVFNPPVNDSHSPLGRRENHTSYPSHIPHSLNTRRFTHTRKGLVENLLGIKWGRAAGTAPSVPPTLDLAPHDPLVIRGGGRPHLGTMTQAPSFHALVEEGDPTKNTVTKQPAETSRHRSQQRGSTYMHMLSMPTRRTSREYYWVTTIAEHSILDAYVAARGNLVMSDPINYG